MFHLVVPTSVKKQLQKSPENVKSRILAKLRDIERDPFQGKKLVGELKGIYSVKVVPYRILYEIRKRELIVLVLRIGDRKEVYH